MAIRDVKYNRFGATVPGATNKGTLAIADGTDTIDYSSNDWYAGVEDNGYYVIATDTYSMGWEIQDNAKPTFWRCNQTDADLLILINQLPERDIQNGGSHFTNITDALNWLNGTNKYALLPLETGGPIGSSGQWVLEVGAHGYQPAFEDGSITVPIYDDGIGTDNFNDIAGLILNQYGLYINGKDSAGNDQTALLQSVIGNSGTIEFVQGANNIKLGFGPGTFGINTYGNLDGIMTENYNNPLLSIISTSNTAFSGWDGSGIPNTSHLLTITIIIT
jgi:hypothetical protein